MTASSVVLTLGVRQAGSLVLGRWSRRPDLREARQARNDARTAAFLETLDLDPAVVLDWPVVPPTAAGLERSPLRVH